MVRSIWTPKSKVGGWGKGEAVFYLDEDKAPEFKTIEAFIDNYSCFTVKPNPEPEITNRVKVKPNAKKKTSGDKS